MNSMSITASGAASGGGGIVVKGNDRKALRRERRLLVKAGRRRRAERRREEAEARRRRGDGEKDEAKKRSSDDDGDYEDVAHSTEDLDRTDRGGRHLDRREEEMKRKNKRRRKEGGVNWKGRVTADARGDPYCHLDPATAAAMRADDEEIAALERKLGLAGAPSDGGDAGEKKKKKNKRRDKLLREYEAEGYGEDFGRFLLDDLDGILSGSGGGGGVVGDRDGDYYREILSRSEEGGGSSAPEDFDSSGEEIVPMKSGAYEDDDDDDDSSDHDSVDDMPSAKGGSMVGSSREKNVRHSKLIDDIPVHDEYDHSDDDSSSSSEGDAGDGVGGDESLHRGLKRGGRYSDDDDDESSSRSSSEGGSDGGTDEDDTDEDEEEDDHPASDTYRPTSGEDIYGNVLNGPSGSGTKPARYVPPHLRRAAAEGKSISGDDDGRGAASSPASSGDLRSKEEEREIRRSMQGTFNRLSSETMESSSKYLAGLYDSHPNGTVNACLADQLCKSCGVAEEDEGGSSSSTAAVVLMSSLIPTVAATVAAVHVAVGDNSVGSTLVERVTLEYVSAQEEARSRCREGDISAYDDGEFTYGKRSSNAALVLCYLYNFDVLHCSFVYGLVRDLISNFTEVDAEVLLLVLRHAGRRMRGDDPSSLRDIIGLVQKRCSTTVSNEGAVRDGGDDDDGAATTTTTTTVSSSRMRCMIDAMTDLRNNKRRKGDEGVLDTIARYRKFVGRIKSTAGERGAADPCLRMTMRDILDMETKGRWWRVGASWRGNQYRDGVEASPGGDGDVVAGDGEEEPRRDLTDGDRGRLRGGDGDTDDELLRLASKMRMNTDLRRSIFCVVMGSADCDDAFEKLVGLGLRGRQEREVVRVIVECCGREKSYNPFYAVLSARLCQFHGRNFGFTFKKTYWDLFDNFDSMKARRAANLAKLCLHLVREGMLSIDVLRVLDVTDVPEAGVIFLTMFFFGMFETFDPSEVSQAFASGFAKDSTNGGALRESLSVFLLRYVKKSPKNVKRSRFNSNFNAAMEACDVAA